jgi:hypothetical protein
MMLTLHPDVSARLSELLDADAVRVFVDQEGHGLREDPRVHIYEWRGDSSPSMRETIHMANDATAHARYVVELPGSARRALLSPVDTAQLRTLLDMHGVAHADPTRG